jgi:hypothetical protein
MSCLEGYAGASPEPSAERPRGRGVRLNSLDRDLVWRIAHTGRRWEVLGPEPLAGCGAAAPEVDGERPPAAAYGDTGRHATPD